MTNNLEKNLADCGFEYNKAKLQEGLKHSS